MPPSCALLGGLQSVHGLRCCGNITRTRNVSEYMLVLAACLVILFCVYFAANKSVYLLTYLLTYYKVQTVVSM